MTERRRLAVVVPVLHNFKGLTELMTSIDYDVYPIIIPNWIENKGVAASWNLGMKIAMAHSIGNVLVVNDDIVFEPGCVYKMMNALYGRIFTSALNTRDFTPAKSEQYDSEPDFACFMVHPAQFVKRVGWFDENFYPAYFEDNDMGYRMQLGGILDESRRLDAPMFHHGSVTQNWEGKQVVNGPQFEKNRLYYRTKWGGVPGEETYKTPHGLGNSFKEW